MRSVLCAILIAGSAVGRLPGGRAQSSQDMLRQLPRNSETMGRTRMTTNSDQDDFTKNLTTFRAEVRAALRT
jgi:hypothetical protein